MKFYLPTQALIAALVTLAPSAWAETITADTEYQYDSADWATDSYFKFDPAVTHYTYTSSPAKEYTLSFSGGPKGVFVNTYYDPEKKTETPVFDYLSFEQLKEVNFSENEAKNYGGAIFSYVGNISLNNNVDVVFNKNTANKTPIPGGGGAISSFFTGNISLNNNTKITFSGNESIDNGGAIYSGNGSITLNNNSYISFNANTTADSGGAIYSGGSDISILNNGDVSFQENIAETLTGGAIHAFNVGNLNNNGNLSFIKNKAKDGGAIHFGKVTLNNNKSVSFIENSATVNAGNAHLWAYGGAIYAGNSGVTLNYNGSVTFSGNRATCSDDPQNSKIRGGAIYSGEGNIALSYNGNVSVSENSAGAVGGAICGEAGLITLNNNDNVSFTKNTAGFIGGAIATNTGFITLNNNGDVSFSENKAGGYGGALYSESENISLRNNAGVSFSKNEAIGGGGAIHSSDGNISLEHNDSLHFSENKTSGIGGAIYAELGDIAILSNGDVLFKGNIAETLTGGAIQAFNIGTLDDNESLSFIGNQAKDGGAIHFGGSTLNYNESVSFIGNIASVKADNANPWAYGGAIYGGRLGIILNNNGSVTFRGNKAICTDNPQNNDILGGAIYSEEGNISLDYNDSVDFSENSAGASGGAICVERGTISLSKNGNVSFSKNTAGSSGGAIYTTSGTINLNHNAGVTFMGNMAYRGGGAIQSFDLVTLDDNGSLSFSGNMGGDGGAIHASGVVLSNNTGDISFTGNKAPGTEPYAKGDGGAIFYSGLGLTIADNKGTVKFSGNRAKRWGGAIYSFIGNAVIANNKEVIFEGNIAAPDGIDRLCGIHLGNAYADPGDPDPVLILSAPQDGTITIKDTIYAVGDVELNKVFHDGNASSESLAQTGLITLSGASAEDDLNNYFASNSITDGNGNIRKATDAEISASRISRIGGTTTLYAGTLELVDGAVLTGANTYDIAGKITGYRNGDLILAEGSNATLFMRNATIDKATTLNNGTRLKLQGANTIKSLTLASDVEITFVVDTVNSSKAVLSLDEGQMPTLNLDKISVVGAKPSTKTGTYLLLDTKNTTRTLATKALNTSGFYWENGVLYCDYVSPVTKLDTIAASRNGQAGAKILLAAHNDSYAEGGALAGIFESAANQKMTDKDLAAVSGASVAVLGQALSGDVVRQLRTIRNRSGVESSGLAVKADDCTFFAWVNAEGDRGEQNNDNTAAGYTLASWGGTLGAGMRINDGLTLGLSLSAMYGDLKSDGPDYLNGDMDTTYVSAFVRYSKDNWNHAFIATFGATDTDYRRSVNHASGSYTAHGDTEGSSFGLMYEVSYDYALSDTSNISPVINIIYRHTKVDAYGETGNDASLSVDDQSLITATLGLGARYEAAIGAPDRACNFAARALVKYDFGDTQTETTVGLINHATRADIESAELGAFGLELGAGISVPVGFGSVFLDGAAELRNDYTSFNTTVGYSIQF